MKTLSIALLALVTGQAHAQFNKSVDACLKKVDEVLGFDTSVSSSTLTFKGLDCEVRMNRNTGVSGLNQLPTSELRIWGPELYLDIDANQDLKTVKLTKCSVTDDLISIEFKGKHLYADRTNYAANLKINLIDKQITSVSMSERSSRLILWLGTERTSCKL